jgi:ISXO2-like transposase domain
LKGQLLARNIGLSRHDLSLALRDIGLFIIDDQLRDHQRDDSDGENNIRQVRCFEISKSLTAIAWVLFGCFLGFWLAKVGHDRRLPFFIASALFAFLAAFIGVPITRSAPAHYLCHRVRAGLQDPAFKKLMGIVEVDETYIGGSDYNRHADKKSGARGLGDPTKTAVIGAVCRKGNVVTPRLISDGLVDEGGAARQAERCRCGSVAPSFSRSRPRGVSAEGRCSGHSQTPVG